VDDPYFFGQVAAANALSDVYAMGGRPLLALNIVCFPKEGLDKNILKEILRGGLEKVQEAGAVLAGGHSVDDREIKFGLSVVGLVHPQKFVTNAGARPGDRLLLTKPLGTGIIATAVKGGLASEAAQKRALEVMTTLNRQASEAMMEVGVHAATDITGFGLLGHALEMANASGVSLTIEAHRVPMIKEAVEYARMGLVPAGDFENKKFCQKVVEVAPGVDSFLLEILYDAQTSGGLLIAVEPAKADRLWEKMLEKGVFEAAFIGEVIPREKEAPIIKVLP
jgi:selenide,water dikinase